MNNNFRKNIHILPHAHLTSVHTNINKILASYVAAATCICIVVFTFSLVGAIFAFLVLANLKSSVPPLLSP